MSLTWGTYLAKCLVQNRVHKNLQCLTLLSQQKDEIGSQIWRFTIPSFDAISNLVPCFLSVPLWLLDPQRRSGLENPNLDIAKAGNCTKPENEEQEV
jgi:hypothetical protein